MSDRKNPGELPEDRLATADETGKRIYLYPADVEGKFRRLRTYCQMVLIIFFLFLPWIRFNGRQALLFDIPNRRFSIFNLTFWGHDAPMMVFVFGGAALGLLLITAVLGRVWCGWACPQTVFTDGVFLRIERWIEGNARSRQKLDQATWHGENWKKLRKKSLKWFVFLVFSLILTHSFLAYFVGTDELLRMVRSSPFVNIEPFVIMALSTLLILFDIGWFREQFCLIVCPYGRLQSVLMDEQSLTVVYDAKRGEPRRGRAPPLGDCVNCYRCVEVCPTGIDIRRGSQMECIACTACIDACDAVMTHLKKPVGLIRYDSLQGLSGGGFNPFRLRTFIYSCLLLVVFLALGYTVAMRSPIDMKVLRAVDTPYQVIGTDLINHFKVDLSNQTFEDVRIKIEPQDPSVQLITALGDEFSLPAGQAKRVDFFLKFPTQSLKNGHARTLLFLSYRPQDGHSISVKRETEVRLVGPFH